MARIDYSDPANASDRTREILGKNRNANIFRMMAHSPSYFEQYCRLGGAIRHKGALDPVLLDSNGSGCVVVDAVVFQG